MKRSLILASLAIFIWSKKTASQEEGISPGVNRFDNWMKSSDDERLSICKEDSKKELTSLEEAVDAVNFTIKYPENLKDEKLLGIFISHANMLTLLFSNGFYITQRESDIVPDYSSFIVESEEDEKNGKLKADQVPKLITVNKFMGMGCEPCTNDFGTYMAPRPGFAEWYEEGVIYSIFGDKTSLARIIDIAHSMKPFRNDTY